MLTAQNQITVRLSHRLFRDHARLLQGEDGDKAWHWSKDLSAINRDLSHVVLVDKEGDQPWQPYPNNCIAVPPWDGDPDDTALLDLLPMLEALAMPDVPDVREVIKLHNPKTRKKAATGSELDTEGEAADDAIGEDEEMTMADSFRLAMRARRKSTREYLKNARGSVFGGGNPQGLQQAQILQQAGGLGVSPAELTAGEVGMVALGVQRLPPERQLLSQTQLEQQMAETMQMQLNEFEAVESPLPMGLKIPKMPSTTDDIAALFSSGSEDDKEEAAAKEKAAMAIMVDEMAAKNSEANGGGAPAQHGEGGGRVWSGGFFSRQK